MMMKPNADKRAIAHTSVIKLNESGQLIVQIFKICDTFPAEPVMQMLHFQQYWKQWRHEHHNLNGFPKKSQTR